MTSLVTLSDLRLLAPELVITLTGLLVLVLDFLVRSRNRDWLGVVGLVGIGVALALVLTRPMGAGRVLAFSGLHIVDGYAAFFKIVFLVSAAIVVLLALRPIQEQGMHPGEFLALVLFATLGTMLMVSAADLLSLFVGIETLSVCTYALCGFLKREQRSTEGALKYLLMGSFSTSVLLYGMALLYGLAGSTNLEVIARAASMAKLSNPALMMAMVLLVAGFGFKIAAVPFHMYLPDMYEGAPTPVVAFMAGAAELAGLGVLVRVFLSAIPALQVDWAVLLWVVAVMTMTIGNLVAIAQANIKRMLAYSTIAQMGYLLIGLIVASQTGVTAVLFHSLAYACMTIGAFGMVVLLQRGAGQGEQIDDFSGLAQRSPLAAGVMLIFLLSLTGIPPTAGFVGKLLLFGAAIEAGYVWLAIIAVVNSAISLFYYMRVAVAMYMREVPAQGIGLSTSPALSVALFLAAGLTLLLGLFPGLLLEMARASAAGIIG
jgi:NADH-quinone oxidoreductase subunit N